MLNHIIQELITKAIEKQTEKIITKKAQKKIQQEEVIFNNLIFLYLVIIKLMLFYSRVLF